MRLECTATYSVLADKADTRTIRPIHIFGVGVLRTSAPSAGSKTFGTITGENGVGPRIAQFSMKFIF